MRLTRQAGNAVANCDAAMNDGARVIQPVTAQIRPAAASDAATVSVSRRNKPKGNAGNPPGSHRAINIMAPSAASAPVRARLMGNSGVLHNGRARTTMSSAPV
jgi:hypothetical protein